MGELFHEFGVDWKLLLAQAVNFIVLLFILKKFLYRPVLEVLAVRREKIEKGLQNAKNAEEKIQKIDVMKEEVLTKAHKEELQIIQEAEVRAKVKEKESAKEAQRKAEEIIAAGKKKIEEEHVKSLDLIYGESASLVKSALVKVFEKSPEVFEDALIEKSLQELKTTRR